MLIKEKKDSKPKNQEKKDLIQSELSQRAAPIVSRTSPVAENLGLLILKLVSSMWMWLWIPYSHKVQVRKISQAAKNCREDHASASKSLKRKMKIQAHKKLLSPQPQLLWLPRGGCPPPRTV